MRIVFFSTQTVAGRKHNGDRVCLHGRAEIEIWIGVANACVRFHERAAVFSCLVSERFFVFAYTSGFAVRKGVCVSDYI